jgi:hypothetical protein
MPSSGILRCVALVRTDVSEELSASIIRVPRLGELGTTLAVTSNWRTLRRNTNWSVFWSREPFLEDNARKENRKDRGVIETSAINKNQWHIEPNLEPDSSRPSGMVRALSTRTSRCCQICSCTLRYATPTTKYRSAAQSSFCRQDSVSAENAEVCLRITLYLKYLWGLRLVTLQIADDGGPTLRAQPLIKPQFYCANKCSDVKMTQDFAQTYHQDNHNPHYVSSCPIVPVWCFDAPRSRGPDYWTRNRTHFTDGAAAYNTPLQFTVCPLANRNYSL